MKHDIRTYFDILSVDYHCSLKEIKENYRILLKVWNPDRFVDDPKVQKFALVKYRELIDAYKKVHLYLSDRHRSHSFNYKDSTAARPYAKKIRFKLINGLVGHNDKILSLSFSPNGKLLASASADGRIKIWDLTKKKCLKTIEDSKFIANSLAFSPDGKILATVAKDNTLKLWRVIGLKPWLMLVRKFFPTAKMASHSNQKNIVHSLELMKIENTPLINAITFSPDSRFIIAGCTDHTLRLYDKKNLKRNFIINNSFNTNRFIVSPNCKFIAGCSDLEMKIWMFTKKPSLELYAMINETGNRCLAYSLDGRYLAAGGKHAVPRLFNTANLKLLNSGANNGNGQKQDSSMINTIAFAPNNRFLATGSSDNHIKIWSIPGLKKIAVLNEHRKNIYAVNFSPDGRKLCSGDGDSTILLWDIEHS